VAVEELRGVVGGVMQGLLQDAAAKLDGSGAQGLRDAGLESYRR